jgi:hypothetical protein
MIRLLDGEIYCPQCGGKRALGWCRDCDGTGTVKKDRLGQPERSQRLASSRGGISSYRWHDMSYVYWKPCNRLPQMWW